MSSIYLNVAQTGISNSQDTAFSRILIEIRLQIETSSHKNFTYVREQQQYVALMLL